MYDNPKRYENDSLYEDEDTDYEDEYEADDFDYIVDDEDEDENALWGDADEDTADEDDTDNPPQKKRRNLSLLTTIPMPRKPRNMKRHGALLQRNSGSSTI